MYFHTSQNVHTDLYQISGINKMVCLQLNYFVEFQIPSLILNCPAFN